MFFGRLAFVFEVMVYVGIGLPFINVVFGLIGNLFGGGAEVDFDTDASGLDLDLDLDTGGAFDAPGNLGADLAPDAGFDFDLDIAPDAGTDLTLDLDVDIGFDADIGDFADLGEMADAGDLGDLSDTSMSARAKLHSPLRFNMYCLCLAMVTTGAMGILALERYTGIVQLAVLAAAFLLGAAAYVLLFRLVISPLQKNDPKAQNISQLRFQTAKVTFRIKPDSPGKIETSDAVGARISYQARMDPDICKVERIGEGETVIITRIDKSQNMCYVAVTKKSNIN